MKCLTCEKTAEGYAVIPGIGDTGEIRFFCDTCARKERVKMRYWDARDLEVGGWREDPDLGDSYHTLVFAFTDIGRMRRDDLITLFEWVEDEEIGAAMMGTDSDLQTRILQSLPRSRSQNVRDIIRQGCSEVLTREARKKISNLVKRL